MINLTSSDILIAPKNVYFRVYRKKSTSQMRVHKKSFRFLNRLFFANSSPPWNVVFGCVWKYDSAEKEEIDNLEGCPDIYSDFELEVELITDLEGLLLAAKPKEGKYPDSFFEPSPFSQLNQHKNKHGTFLKCLVYKHNNTSDYLLGNGRASPAYKKVMIEGAKQHNFPDFYMKHLDDIQVNDVPITSVLMAKDISEMCGFEIVKKGRGL